MRCDDGDNTFHFVFIIFTLKQAMQRRRKFNSETLLAFVDYGKASVVLIEKNVCQKWGKADIPDENCVLPYKNILVINNSERINS